MLGTLIEGRYRVTAQVGAGGMGSVWEAQDLETSSKVAVKFLSGRAVGGEQAERRFEREFTATVRLVHPGIVAVHRAGRLDDGTMYMVMDLLPHPSLAAVLAGGGPLEPTGAAHLGRRLAEALAYCHAHGVVHRDLKPANVLMAPDGSPVLIDFGLARSVDGTAMTATGQLIGTPLYMAPEQLAGRRVDGRCDLFQLGVLLYESLAGSNPFRAPTVPEVARRIMEGVRSPITQVRPGLAPAWDAVLGRLMARRPEDRYAAAEPAATDLAALERGQEPPSISPEPPSRSRPPRPAPPPSSTPLPLPPAASGARNSSSSLVALVAVFCLGAVAGWLAGHGASGGPVVGGEATAVGGLVSEAFPGGVEIRWVTDRDQPSRVELLTPRTGVVEGEAGVPTRSHVVRVTDLPDGAPCSFRIVFPGGGRSLVQSAQAGSLTVNLQGVSGAGDDAVLRWRVPGVVSCRARVEGRAGVVDVAVRGAGGDAFEVPLRRLVPGARSVVVSAELADGRWRSFLLSEVLERRVDEILRSLDADPGKVVEGVLDALSADDRDGVRGRGVMRYPATLRETLEATGRKAAYVEARDLAPLVFGSSLLDRGRTMALYRGILSYVQLALWSPVMVGERNFDPTPLPELGALSLGLEPSIRATRSLPLRLPAAGRLRMAVRTEPGSDLVQEWAGSVELAAPERLEAAELRVAVSLMGPTHLLVTAGAAPGPLGLYDLAMFGRLDNSLFVRSGSGGSALDIGGALVEMTSVNHLYQRIPVEWLVRGRNRFEFRAATISSRGVSWNRLGLLDVTLMLQERPGEPHSP